MKLVEEAFMYWRTPWRQKNDEYDVEGARFRAVIATICVSVLAFLVIAQHFHIRIHF